MGGEHKETPRGWQADTGCDGNRYANAADTPNVSENPSKRHCLVRLWATIQAFAAGVAS